MTMSPVEIERKVRQLDNDVESIYEMLAAIQGTQQRHSNRFQEISEKLDTVDQTVATLDEHVGTLDGKVDTLGHKVGALDGKVDTLDHKVATLDGKVDTIDHKVATLDGKVDTIDHKMDTVLELLRSSPPTSG